MADVYKKAFEARYKPDRTLNPISRNHATIPYDVTLENIISALNAERGKSQPAIPASAWADNVLYEASHFLTMKNTWFPFRAVTKDHRRTQQTLSIALLYEYYLVGEYRPALLKGPPGLIRHKLFDILGSELPRSMRHEVDGVTYMWFADGYYFPSVEDNNTVNSEALRAGHDLQASLVKEVGAFAKHFKLMKSLSLHTSRYLPDEGPHAQADVAKRFNALMHVSVFTCFHPISTDSCYCSGLEQECARFCTADYLRRA